VSIIFALFLADRTDLTAPILQFNAYPNSKGRADHAWGAIPPAEGGIAHRGHAGSSGLLRLIQVALAAFRFGAIWCGAIFGRIAPAARRASGTATAGAGTIPGLRNVSFTYPAGIVTSGALHVVSCFIGNGGRVARSSWELQWQFAKDNGDVKKNPPSGGR
jgi:hypothetical protein